MEAHTKTDLVCAQCDKSFCSNSDFDYHMMAHRSDKTYTCSRCDKAFVLDGQLKKHIQTVHDLDWDACTKTKMGCNQCYESFSSQSCFDYHMKAHSGENSLTCSRCYQPIIRGQMRLHIKKIFMNLRKIPRYVSSVTNLSVVKMVSTTIWKHTLEKNCTLAVNVIKHLL